MRPAAIVFGVLALGLSISEIAIAQNAGCIFREHSPAAVFVEYTYTTKDNETGREKGSGFVVSQSGHIVTNAHVVRPNDKGIVPTKEAVSVRIGGLRSSEEPAIIIRRDDEMDLALLKISVGANVLPTIPIGTSTGMDVGDKLTGLGYPDSDVAIVPQAEITARNTVADGALRPWWQTGLALNPGNSGGPVFGKLGTIVGIAVAVRRNAQLISYVIPIQYARIIEEAGVKPTLAGPCADLPTCRHQKHGLDKYAIDVTADGWSGWRGGGYNRTAYCNDLLTSLRRSYPNSEFSKIRDDEESRDKGFRQIEYRYYCAFRRTEQPIYKEDRTVACVSNQAQP